MKAATLLPLLLLASSAEAQNRFFSSTWGRSPMGAKYAATLYAGDGVVLAKSTELADIEADIFARNACNNAGKVYLPASPDADAGGCVDPATWVAGSWAVGAWGACSATCGDGTQTRAVTCQKNGTTVPDTKCPAPKPATSQACNTQACATCTVSRPLGGQTTYTAGATISCNKCSNSPVYATCKNGITTNPDASGGTEQTTTDHPAEWTFISSMGSGCGGSGSTTIYFYKCQ